MQQIAPRWNGFKARYLRSQSNRVHEPQIRGKRLSYLLKAHSGLSPDHFMGDLSEILTETPFAIIAAVISKNEYAQQYKDSPVDAFLPLSQYHVALNFVLERIVHYLHYEANDAKGFVIAERSGAKEAAELKREYARMQLEGTQYVSDSWFRYQLDESLLFAEKDDLIPGLEITDVIARPIAEKVLNQGSTPTR